MARVLLWGKFASPSHVRNNYFTSGFGDVTKEAGRLALAELRAGVSTAGQPIRDMFTLRNRDWRHVGGTL
jgi:FADH2 O2-dependent halogenase